MIMSKFLLKVIPVVTALMFIFLLDFQVFAQSCSYPSSYSYNAFHFPAPTCSAPVYENVGPGEIRLVYVNTGSTYDIQVVNAPFDVRLIGYNWSANTSNPPWISGFEHRFSQFNESYTEWTSTFTGYMALITWRNTCGGYNGSSTSNSAVLRITESGADGLWEGTVDTDCQDPLNWSCDLLPTQFTSVTIPGGTPNDPGGCNLDLSQIDIRSGPVMNVNTMNVFCDDNGYRACSSPPYH